MATRIPPSAAARDALSPSPGSGKRIKLLELVLGAETVPETPEIASGFTSTSPSPVPVESVTDTEKAGPDNLAEHGEKLDELLPASTASDSGSFSDLEEISAEAMARADEARQIERPRKAMQRTVYETRMFLKQRGMGAFLEEYVPPTADSEQILNLILKLGFCPRNMPPLDEGEHLLDLTRLLGEAIKRVLRCRPRLVDFYTVDHVLDKLRTANRILVITGAGISTSLGIPDFRSSQGFYLKLGNLGLSDPQEVFDLSIFHADPLIFYSIAHMILPPDGVYTPLHKFIALLEKKGKLLRNYTQNIDNLEANAGISYDKMIQCHGSFAFASCVTCKYQVPGHQLFPKMRAHEIPYCPKCAPKRKRFEEMDVVVDESYGVMKPNITFFGEPLPPVFHNNLLPDMCLCDLVISIGTSLKVAPVADIVHKIPPHVPQILINRDPISHCNFDVNLLGFCDEVVSYLCEKLGDEWDIDHEQYQELIGEDRQNLVLTPQSERGFYNISRKDYVPEVTNLVTPDLQVLSAEI